MTGGSDASSSLGVTDPQYPAHTTSGLELGRPRDRRPFGAVRLANRAADVTIFFNPLALPIAARAALWSGDLAGARVALDGLGQKITADVP